MLENQTQIKHFSDKDKEDNHKHRCYISRINQNVTRSGVERLRHERHRDDEENPYFVEMQTQMQTHKIIKSQANTQSSHSP